jgi:hypothetical protein
MAGYITSEVTTAVIIGDTPEDDNQLIVTASGSIAVSEGVAVKLASTAEAYASIDGSIYSTDTGIAFTTFGSSITVSASGIVHGHVYAVSLSGSDNTLRNAGEIRASDAGSVNTGVRFSGIDNYVVNSGSISGVFGLRFELLGFMNQIVNTGTISGSNTAIDLSRTISFAPGFSASAIDPSRYGVFNGGSILGGSMGIAGVGPIRVVNTGLIQAADIAVLFDTVDLSDQTSLTNSGTVIGAFVFQGESGGTLFSIQGICRDA